MGNEVMTETAVNQNEIKLQRKDLLGSWFRWVCFGQTCYNYERMQGMGFCHSMIPIINRLYTRKEDRAAALQRHMTYYNTENNWGAAVAGIAASMEEQRANGADIDDDAINGIKTSLMGPLAGIGDTVTQSLVKTIFLSVGCSLALSGNILGPILFFIGMSAYALGLSYYVYFMGYNSGKTSITKLLRSGLVKNVSEALGALGMMVLGAMVAANIGVTTPLAFTVGGSEIVLQTILDSILPKMLPLLIFFGTYRLVVKGKKSTYIIAGMFIVGILGSVLHILG
jgi:PTS system mannose-specific IID component